MKKTILALIFLVGCASMSGVIPTLENRTLRFSPDKPQLEYQYEVCSKKILGICTKHEMTKDTYDLTDPAVRLQIVNMGFVARVKDKSP